MADDLLEQGLKDLAAQVESGPGIEIRLTFLEAWAILRLLQETLHQPHRTDPSRSLIEEVARRIQREIATTPALEEIAKRGWHAEFDE